MYDNHDLLESGARDRSPHVFSPSKYVLLGTMLLVCVAVLAPVKRHHVAQPTLQGGVAFQAKEDYHSSNDTVEGLPIHSFWFPRSSTSGCRWVADESTVKSVFPEMSEHQRTAIPTCLHEVFDDFHHSARSMNVSKAQAALGVDALFVLHYPKLRDRRRGLEEQLAAAGLAGTATWVDWSDLYQRIANTSTLCCIYDCDSIWFRDFAAPGTRDCSLRHLFVSYEMHRQGLRDAIVMEDDAALEYNASMIRSVVQRAPQGYTAIMLSGTRDWYACAPRSAGDASIPRIIGPGFGARTGSGYLLSSRGAEALLRKMYGLGKGIDLPADLIMDGAINGGCYWAEPPLWSQTQGGGAGNINTSSRMP